MLDATLYIRPGTTVGIFADNLAHLRTICLEQIDDCRQYPLLIDGEWNVFQRGVELLGTSHPQVWGIDQDFSWIE